MNQGIEILIGTSNPGKEREIRRMLAGLAVKLRSLAEFPDAPRIEEGTKTFRKNAIRKAITFARFSGRWAIGEDSGLEVDALGGRPGVMSSRYAGPEATDEENNRKLLAELRGVPSDRRSARYRCVVALASPSKVLALATGTCEGRIAERPAGTGGFGYDPIFFYEPYGRTFGEVSPDDKNAVSHRAMALARLRQELEELLKQHPSNRAGPSQLT